MRRPGRNAGTRGGGAPHGRAVVRLAAIAVLLSVAGCASLEGCRAQGCAQDRRISGEVRAILEGHPALESPNLVTVQTLNRVVYLNGLVDTPYQKELAAALARQAPGTVRVVNLIGVSNGSR
jgi:osmotically-inducible protein OsmY